MILIHNIELGRRSSIINHMKLVERNEKHISEIGKR